MATMGKGTEAKEDDPIYKRGAVGITIPSKKKSVASEQSSNQVASQSNEKSHTEKAMKDQDIEK